MGPELTALFGFLISVGTLLVGYWGLRSKATTTFVDTIVIRLSKVEQALEACHAREREMAEKLVAAYSLAAEEQRRVAAIETEANKLRQKLIEIKAQ